MPPTHCHLFLPQLALMHIHIFPTALCSALLLCSYGGQQVRGGKQKAYVPSSSSSSSVLWPPFRRRSGSCFVIMNFLEQTPCIFPWHPGILAAATADDQQPQQTRYKNKNENENKNENQKPTWSILLAPQSMCLSS